MKGYLLDTNVISEIRKGHRADPKLMAWANSIDPESTHISVLTLGEIRRGIELVRVKDPNQAAAIEGWLSKTEIEFADRILSINAAEADKWGRMCAVRPLPLVDALLGASAVIADLTLVTRNVDDFRDTGVSVLNPF